MAIWWPLCSICLLVLCPSSKSEPLNFDPFFNPETTFFSPQEDGGPFHGFAGYSFSAGGGGGQQAPLYQETSNIPVYTDGVATPPQVTLSRLEKDYKSQLHRLANTRTVTTIRTRPRVLKFISEPFSSASNVEERQPASSSNQKVTEDRGPRFSLPKSQPIEIQTGFIPIIKGQSTQDQRSINKDIASTVIKDIEPPILTAPSSLTTRPHLLKVSASVQSSSKVSPNSQRVNSSTVSSKEVKARPRQASFSRFLNHESGPRTSAASSSSSESIVSRVISGPESNANAQQKDFLRLSSSSSVIFEENKLEAKRTLDINCEGSHDLGWCELEDKYPRKYVNDVISSCQEVVDRMHIEIPHSFEKLSDTSDFKAELDNSSRRSAKERGSHDAWSWAAYFHQGSLCDAETGFLRPETAKDTSGSWNIIVQTDSIRQRVPIEMCRKTNGSCKKMLNCGLKSQCLQKYNYHLLLSLNPTQKHDCPFMKLYRFPSACVCHVE